MEAGGNETNRTVERAVREAVCLAAERQTHTIYGNEKPEKQDFKSPQITPSLLKPVAEAFFLPHLVQGLFKAVKEGVSSVFISPLRGWASEQVLRRETRGPSNL